MSVSFVIKLYLVGGIPKFIVIRGQDFISFKHCCYTWDNDHYQIVIYLSKQKIKKRMNFIKQKKKQYNTSNFVSIINFLS